MPTQDGAVAGSSKRPTNNNPRGINKHKHCPPANDPRVPELLRAYHRQGITDRKRLSKLLRDEHGVILSESTVARRRRLLGLKASGRTTAELPDAEKRRLVLDQMVKDPAGKIGAEIVKARILQKTGIDITREWIRREMQRLEPQAFMARTPHKKAARLISPSTRTTANRTSQSSRSDPTSTVQEHLTESNNPASQTRLASAPDSPCLRPGAEDSDFDEEAEHLTGEFHNNSDYDNRSSQLHPVPPFHDDPLWHQHQPAHVPPAIPSAPLPPSPLQNMLNEATPKLVALTQFLRMLGPGGGRLDAPTPESVMHCMEAAAMLEHELSRVASASGP
ncbi:hypothetical protein FPV67DRAFT_1500841 [Lyophyllum atratum]|nr:hypothetical protein FPV67DRAFT_1500841 [Lyophyllum atratum]